MAGLWKKKFLCIYPLPAYSHLPESNIYSMFVQCTCSRWWWWWEGGEEYVKSISGVRTLAKIFYYVVAFEFVALPEKSTFSARGFISLICCSKGNRTHRKGHELLKKVTRTMMTHPWWLGQDKCQSCSITTKSMTKVCMTKLMRRSVKIRFDIRSASSINRTFM